MEELLLNPFIAPLAAFGAALVISLLAIPVVVKVTSIRHLTDTPGYRKIHQREVPTLGGVGIYAGFAVGFLLSINGYMTGVNFFVLATIILFFAGMKDDLIRLDPLKKLFAEVLMTIMLVYFTDIRVTNFHGLFGITEIPWWATYMFTIFAFIVVINALNLIDGIDGLAASTGIISSVALGIIFVLSGNTGYAIMSAALAGALVGFLRYNASDGKYKIFMGDTGSLLIGFILASMTILFNEIHANGGTAFRDLGSAPAISIAILIVPLFDTLRVFTIRVLRGQHPFIADNRHIHHLLLRTGLTHLKATGLISAFHILMIVLAFSLDDIGIFWLSTLLLTICMMLVGIIYIRIYINHVTGRLPVKKEDIRMVRLIASVHRSLTGKPVPVPVVRKTNGGGVVLPVQGIGIERTELGKKVTDKEGEKA